MATDTGVRHHRDRPMRQLTDNELGALTELLNGSVMRLLDSRLRDDLETLEELAQRELIERST